MRAAVRFQVPPVSILIRQVRHNARQHLGQSAEMLDGRSHQISLAATVIFRCSLQMVAFTVPNKVLVGAVLGA